MRPRLLICLAVVLSGTGVSFWYLPTVGSEEQQQTAKEKAKPANHLPGIVFVGAPIFDEETDGGQGVYQGSYHWRDSYVYARSATYHRAERTMGPVRPGRNLYSLIPAQPDGKLTRLTHLTTGAVFKPEPSFDGQKVLFSMRRDGEDWFHLYEINVDGTGLRQLTDGPFNDFAGSYLPNGQIVFCSDRTGYLEEYHEERTETLFVMNGNGTGIQQITFAPGTYFEPTVLRDGRILFSFWDAFHIDVPPFDKHETFLMTVNPDGSEERHLFGAGQYRFFNRERHSGIGLTQAREMPDGRLLVQSELGPCLLDLRAGTAVEDALTPLFPGMTSVQLGGTTHRSHLSPLGTRSTAYPLSDGRIIFSATAPGARDSELRIVDPASRAEQLVLNIPNHAEFDAVPVLIERPRPAVLPTKVKPEQKTARFLVVAGRETDNEERAQALRQARFFRVIETEYTGVTTSSHTNLETRILGVVPILPDGSAYFEAPANTPLFLDPLDAAGNRVLMNWNLPNTSVGEGLPYPATQMAYMVGRNGEFKSCYGCHAPQNEAVPNVPLAALRLGPVQITRDSTDLQYRRNEPEAYRRQARIGEAAKYRPWLRSDDPVVRARACEMLMYIEDGTEADVPTIVKLLKDDAVTVRRAAALALTRLATIQHQEDLQQALQDDDWQVRFAAFAALEALGVVDPNEREAFQSVDKQTQFSFTELRLIPWEIAGWQKATAEIKAKVRAELAKPIPRTDPERKYAIVLPADAKDQQVEFTDVRALRAAGKLQDAEAVPLLVPWLTRHEFEYHAAEAAVALGRIGSPEAVSALWQALRSEVPIKRVHIARYLQHGPRPEEYALLQGLILADARPALDDVHLLIALLPNTFMEKPRFEDRLRDESQRVLMPRLLLEKAGLRQRAVSILLAALSGEQQKDDPLYQQILKGINLERPFSEHGRPFPVVDKISGEEALWLLGCLLEPAADLGRLIERQELEARVTPFLTSDNHRERIDAAVLLGISGFGPKAAAVLAAESAKPYAFGEIWSIGKGMPDTNFRDKAYFVQALAQHVADVARLQQFADPRMMTRDIRYGLARGLARRAKADAIPLLIDMATRDPITLIRQQARYALTDIQDAYRLAGQPVPKVELPPEQPLEALYPPRGLTWTDAQLSQAMPPTAAVPRECDDWGDYVQKCLAPTHFRNLNNAQAKGSERLMIAHIEETRQAFAHIARLPAQERHPILLKALDAPYPYVNYLALATLIEANDKEMAPVLLRKLEDYHKAVNTVGLWWCCEALAQFHAQDAVPVLKKFVTTKNPPNTFGPEGMPMAFSAAKALIQIQARQLTKEQMAALGETLTQPQWMVEESHNPFPDDPSLRDPDVSDAQRLVRHPNVWFRTAALRGLAEGGAADVEKLLHLAAQENQPALVRGEARVQLERLRKE
ncbi:MAG: HEAT repeat domain-containing protein [Gemmataceae bacterium]